MLHSDAAEDIVQLPDPHFDLLGPLLLNQETACAGIRDAHGEVQRPFRTPRALWNDNHTSLGNFLGKIAADTFDIHRIRFYHDHFRSTVPERIISECADVRADIHHDVPRTDL